MRVTEKMVFRQSINDVSNQRLELFSLQQQGATGKKFQRIEEDPIAAERIRLLREARAATDHYEKNISRSRTQLDAADSALGEATNLLIRGKELAMVAANGTLNAHQRSIVANEVESLLTSMVGVANTKAGGEYVFGGFLTETRPFQDDGTFVGNNGVKEVDVGPNARQAVNVSGEEAFTVAGGLDVFAVLSDLETALRADDLPNIQASLDTLATSIDQISESRTDAGLKLNQLDVAENVRVRIHDSLLGEESGLIDIDPVKVFMELNETTRALQDAISVSQRVTNTSFIGAG